MGINWNVVTAAHVGLAIKEFDSGARPVRDAKNTFLLADRRRYPAKFIRGLAYQKATGQTLDPSTEYSGGRQTMDFFLARGFTVEYKGKLYGS
jgi:hypothetical protein